MGRIGRYCWLLLLASTVSPAEAQEPIQVRHEGNQVVISAVSRDGQSVSLRTSLNAPVGAVLERLEEQNVPLSASSLASLAQALNEPGAASPSIQGALTSVVDAQAQLALRSDYLETIVRELADSRALQDGQLRAVEQEARAAHTAVATFREEELAPLKGQVQTARAEMAEIRGNFNLFIGALLVLTIGGALATLFSVLSSRQPTLPKARASPRAAAY